MIDNKTKTSIKWDVWKKFTHSKKKEKTNKDIFIENWHQIQVYYYKGFLNSSKPISQTGLTHNLKQLSKCLITETEASSSENKIKAYNPDGCLEYFIEKQIAVKLVDYATKNVPIGVHLEVLKLFEQILSCDTIFLNLFPELNFRTSFHNLLLLSLNFPKHSPYSSKKSYDSYDEIKTELIKLIKVIFGQLINNPSYISFFYNNKKIFNESSSNNNCDFVLPSDVSSQFLIFDILFKLFSENVKSFSLYDQTVLLGMDLLSKLESIHYATNDLINQENFNDIFKTNKRNDISLLKFSDIVDSHHISSIEEEILFYVLTKSSIFEIINEQFALLYAAVIVNLPSSDNHEMDLHNIMNIYMYQQNISFHPKHSKHILKSYISAIKTKYPVLKTNYSYNVNEYSERLLSYWTFINIILERSPKCFFWKYLEKFEQYVINSFILLDFQNEEFGLNSTICINDLFCKSNISKLKELLFLIVWKNQKLVLKRISQTEDKILSYETLKLLYNMMSGYDYYVYRYIISNFLIDNKKIYNLEKYKQKQLNDLEEDIIKEFSDEKTKSYNNFFYNIILNLIHLIPKEVIDTNNEFDLFLNGVEKNFFLTHDIKDSQIIPNSLISKGNSSNENNNTNSHTNSHTNSLIQKNEDSISQETLVGNDSLFLTPSSSYDRLNINTQYNSDEFDIIEKEEELKLKNFQDLYSVCPTNVYVRESYERIRNCTKIMMSWNEKTEDKNDDEINKLMLLSSEIKTNFCNELIRCLENFFKYDYEHNVLLTGCISRLFYLINDEFHVKLFKNEDHTNSIFIQTLKKLSQYAKRISSTIENFTKKLKYIKQEIYFDEIYETISNKSFYSNMTYKDYTKLLDITYEENQFLFSYILLQEFIKEIISVEMAFIMFDTEPETKNSHPEIAISESFGKEVDSEVKSIESESMSTSDVLNIIDAVLIKDKDIQGAEKELKEIHKEIKKLHLDEAFLKELEKEENKEEDADEVMKNIEETNDVIMKSIQQNFSKQYLFEDDQFSDSVSHINKTQTITADNISCSLDLFGNISHDTTTSNENNNELNITQEIKKLNALFNNGTINDLGNPFDYESFFIENSITNSTNDLSSIMNLRRNSSGSFLYDGDTIGNYAFNSSRRKSSLMKHPTTTVEDEIQEVDFDRVVYRKFDEDNLNTSSPVMKKQNSNEIQIPSLVSESNSEYYKYLKELPSSPVLPPTLLKTNDDDHSSPSGSFIDPMENEDDLAYLEYLENLSFDSKTKRKEEKLNNSSSKKENGNKEKIRNAKMEDEFKRNSSSPTITSVNSLINDIDDENKSKFNDKNNENDDEDDGNENENIESSKNGKNLKSRINNNVEKFFTNQKQKINSIFNHKSNTVKPEIVDDDNTYISVKKDESNIYDSSYTEYYSETFNESSFLKKNLNSGFGYL